jgi:hypothetical protein
MQPVNTCPAFPSSTEGVWGCEYFKDRLSPHDIKCISLTLPQGKILYQPGLSNIVQKIINCTQSREILNNVLQNGPITILSADKSGAPLEGAWEPPTRVVRLDTDQCTGRKLGHLLFELCSAENFA